MTRYLKHLFAWPLAFWLLVSYPTYLLGGETSLVDSALACVLCLVPAVVTMIWGRWALEATPANRMILVLGGSGFRMFFVLGAGLACSFALPDFRRAGFWLWLLVFYLFTLALEVVTLLMMLPSGKSSSEPEA